MNSTTLVCFRNDILYLRLPTFINGMNFLYYK